MTATQVSERLASAGVRPSAQRRAIGEYVLFTKDHPSAEDVIDVLETGVARRASATKISRATVYNTLNLFVERGLLKELVIEEGHVVFDPRLDPHHHFLDKETGEIFDVPLESVPLGPLCQLEDFKVDEVQIVLRGSRQPDVRSSPRTTPARSRREARSPRHK